MMVVNTQDILPTRLSTDKALTTQKNITRRAKKLKSRRL